MSLRPPVPPAIPADTAAAARKAFRRGNPYLLLRDTFGVFFTDDEFTALYAHQGPPALSPACLAMVTLLQYAEHLSDIQAAEAVRARLDWKYLLGLALDDDGFDASALCAFRTRLLKAGAEATLFTRLLERFMAQQLVHAGGRQRTDSTHVLAAIRSLNRVELVRETMRQTLNVLAQLAPTWLRQQSQPAWLERYGERLDAGRLAKTEQAYQALAVQIGRDGQALLTALDDPAAPSYLGEIEAVQTLRTIWAQQYQQDSGTIRFRPRAELPPTAELLCSPYEQDARYSMKRDTAWEGYKIHLTETCEPDQPMLITQVETTVATTPDCQSTAAIQADLDARDLAPGQQFVDEGYVDAELLITSQQQHGIALMGPIQADRSWQARAGTGYDRTHFVVDWDREQATCPKHKQSVRWHEHENARGAQVIQIHFAQADCQVCPVKADCTRAIRRSLTLYTREQDDALLAARARQTTEAFKEAYKTRSGIEGTISQGVRRCGMRHARYRGQAKVRLQHLVTASALNLARVAAWLTHTPRSGTRQSSFTRLMAQPA